LAALRYFYEEKPALPVVAAGSLLELALNTQDYSMPVGRIEYFHLGPLFFSEYLTAQGESRLVDYLEQFGNPDGFSSTAHEQLLFHLRNFMLVGGMPEAVQTYVNEKSIRAVLDVHTSIVETFRDDFGKYGTQSELIHLRRVFDLVPTIVGEKIKYANIDPNVKSTTIRHAIDLLESARVLHRVRHSDGSNIPLEATVDDKVYKPIWLDVGLMNATAGVADLKIEQFHSHRFVNEGPMAEQFVGQHLLYLGEPGRRPTLYYWLREGKKNNAEVDFLWQKGTQIIPVEVKAGKSGTLKSLLQFVFEKKTEIAVRFDLNPPSLMDVEHAIRTRNAVETVKFILLSLPLYMAEYFARIDCGIG